MDINAIPNNMEKYMALMLGKHLIFLDSFQFMSSSLDRLANNLPDEEYKYTSEVFKDEKFKIMQHITWTALISLMKNYQEKMNFTVFFEMCTYLMIKCTQNVWQTFNLKTMGQYHDLYLRSDILLLTDVFENLRKTCLVYYHLDPYHYFSSPRMSWDAMLKMTNIKLELMTEIDIFQYIEKGMHGGISYISIRYGKANNKYIKKL